MSKVVMKGDKVPVIFLGHGSPMNAIEDNDFTRTLTRLGESLPRPQAILMISAHWETQGTWVTGMERPRTIHDFYGFPKPLSEIQYPAPGAPLLAQRLASEISSPQIKIDFEQWGLDHGTWSVLRYLYPKADIPVFQLSLDRAQSFEFHYALGRELSFFREQGVMIMGSGNIVHNLKTINWSHQATPYDWALEFDEWVKARLQERDDMSLVSDALKSRAGQLSIPTPEHYLPLLYVLGASSQSDQLVFHYEGIQNSSISMRCVGYY